MAEAVASKEEESQRRNIGDFEVGGKGATNPAMQAASRRWKERENGFSPRVQKGKQPCQHLDFNSARPRIDSSCIEIGGDKHVSSHKVCNS